MISICSDLELQQILNNKWNDIFDGKNNDEIFVADNDMVYELYSSSNNSMKNGTVNYPDEPINSGRKNSKQWNSLAVSCIFQKWKLQGHKWFLYFTLCKKFCIEDGPEIDLIEHGAYIKQKIIAGVYKSHGEHLTSLWGEKHGRPMSIFKWLGLISIL